MTAKKDAEPKKPNALVQLWEGLGTLASRWLDLSAVHGARLSAIEARLAALDGGNDAAQAKRAAIVAANAERAANGKDPLGLRMASDGESIEWFGTDTMGRPKQ